MESDFSVRSLRDRESLTSCEIKAPVNNDWFLLTNYLEVFVNFLRNNNYLIADFYQKMTKIYFRLMGRAVTLTIGKSGSETPTMAK